MSTAGSPARSRKILLACALARETRALQPLAARRGVDLLTTGMGRRRTTICLEEQLPVRDPTLLIFTGVAGALAPHLPPGEVVFPESWRLPEGETFLSAPGLLGHLRERGWTISGTGLTVPRPVLRPRTRSRLHAETGAAICDMEAAHALRVAARFQVPALALKVVSDTGGDNLADFWRGLDLNLEKLGTEIERLLQDLSGLPG